MKARVMVWRWQWRYAEERANLISLAYRGITCTCRVDHGFLRTILTIEFKGDPAEQAAEALNKAVRYVLDIPGSKHLE